ncbi:AraC family transcriptional regulator [Hoeflea poritis]|uniref:AraC family transcriptional regulator n=1 Tax=Hoeflea poritis TaxID=2993659 RepID=A0ABT4VIM4_9HYPH|nr:AraC family transcriptional regulator [Hoeflea poritis]MDA4844035.1 AraC family transcriptional regulator [Hoeflea poritis]
MTPLSQYALFRTGDPEQARDMVARKFCGHKLEPLADRSAFDACHHFAPGAMLAINYMRYGATVLIEPGELQEFYLIQIPIAGGARITNGGIAFDSDLGNGTILNPDRTTRMVWYSGCEQLLIYIDRRALTGFAERLIGRAITTPLVFDPQISFARKAARDWRKRVMAIYSAADEGCLFTADSGHAQRLLEEELMAMFLRLQPSNISQFFHDDPASLAPGYVTRARRFIAENARHPIALSDIAAAADVSVRALQYEFMKSLSMSPMQALRKERLMQIRQELASGHCDATVARVAAKWGMPHFGRFSQYYAAEYGELPSSTKSASKLLRQ